MMASMIEKKCQIEGSFLQDGQNLDYKENILSDEDQAIIHQYEVSCIAFICPIELMLDKIEASLLKILSSLADENLQGFLRTQEYEMN